MTLAQKKARRDFETSKPFPQLHQAVVQPEAISSTISSRVCGISMVRPAAATKVALRIGSVSLRARTLVIRRRCRPRCSSGSLSVAIGEMRGSASPQETGLLPASIAYYHLQPARHASRRAFLLFHGSRRMSRNFDHIAVSRSTARRVMLSKNGRDACQTIQNASGG